MTESFVSRRPSQRQELGRVDTPCNGVTAFLWRPEADGVLVGTRGGDLLLITFPPGAGPSVEEIGYVEGGVKGAAWSPDGMRLVLVSGNGQLLIMSEVRSDAGYVMGNWGRSMED